MSYTKADALRADGAPIGDVFLTRGELAARVAELAAALDAELGDCEPIFVAPLKSSIVFLADLSRAVRCDHTIDTIELSAYPGAATGGGAAVTKDLDRAVTGRHVVVVEDVVDTGLTLAFVLRTLQAQQPASLRAVTLLDRPYRRLVGDLPLRHVGFTVPDELFAGYGLGLDERWRSLPDLHTILADELPRALDAA